MKRFVSVLIAIAALISTFAFCESANESQEIIDKLLTGNSEYLIAENEKVSPSKRKDTTENGQHPYAVVVTCSDSRVPAELIFDAGIGELFVIRTAGNVIGDYELGSIEYGAEHLHAPLVVVLGHTNCGAVAAALEGEAHGYIANIVDEIAACLPENCESSQAEILNMQNSISNIRTSEIMQELEAAGEVTIIGAIYDIESGKVTFFPEVS